ncbi:preprotein translocase subunit SecG [candidate division KSB1 bacterium]|nr:preprotein translocase subunit SecG [candidate division KSB1 bacterium]
MYTFLIAIFILVSILLTFVILIQSSKGGGLAGTFGGSDPMGTVFGGRGSGDFLTRITAILATVFMVLALILGLMTRGGLDDASLVEQERDRRMSSSSRILPQVPEAEQELPVQGQPPVQENESEQ